MRILHELAAERGGLIPTFRLRHAGFTPRHIAALRHAGLITRARQGWYLVPGARPSVVHAVRVGGQLTCGEALAAFGVWVMRDHRLHVAVDAHAVRLRTPNDPTRRLGPQHPNVVVHWRRSSTATTGPVADVASALADLERCGSFEAFAVALDSALHHGLIAHHSDLAQRYSARGVTGVCESGTETLFWLRFHRLQRQLRRQVEMPGLGRVDFLLGERLVIEIDGKEFHDKENSFESDRRRDAELARRGYRVVRFSYRQVMDEWPMVERTIRLLLAQGEHRVRRGSPLRSRNK